VLECAGVPAAVPEGFEMAAPGARCLVLGQYTDRGPTPINPHVITRKQLRVLGSWGFAEKHYQGHLRALPNIAKRFDLDKLVTEYPLTDANQALADMAAGRVMKPLLVPHDASA
jgi:threonine dehydrogenase-like Zn-dependent dehydrogenase